MKNNARVYVETASDGLPSIIVDVDSTPEQIEYQAKESEFHRTMRLLQANNGAGYMTPAMWLLYEDAYYQQWYTDLSRWKVYLKKMDKENEKPKT